MPQKLYYIFKFNNEKIKSEFAVANQLRSINIEPTTQC